MQQLLHEGQLVQIISKNRHYTEDGFATSTTTMKGDSELVLFESINLESYPSWNDFHGLSITVQHGSYATVLKRSGRPLQIQSGKNWSMYDVYEVLIGKHICHVFRHNLTII